MAVGQEMIETHPRRTSNPGLTRCIEAYFECAQACTACADACLADEKVAQLVALHPPEPRLRRRV